MKNYYGELGSKKEDVLKHIAPILNEFLLAQNKGDLGAFCDLFDDMTKPTVDKKLFIKWQKELHLSCGKFLSADFITSLRQYNYPTFYFKLNSSTSDEDYILIITVNDTLIFPRIRGIWLM